MALSDSDKIVRAVFVEFCKNSKESLSLHDTSWGFTYISVLLVRDSEHPISQDGLDRIQQICDGLSLALKLNVYVKITTITSKVESKYEG